MGQDVTELLREKSESTRIANDLTRLIGTANAPIFGVDTAGLVTEWNSAAAELTGYTPEEAAGRNLVEFVRPESQGSVGEVLRQALDGTGTARYELPLVSKAGKEHLVLLSANPRRDAEGRVTGVVGVGQDERGHANANANVRTRARTRATQHDNPAEHRRT